MAPIGTAGQSIIERIFIMIYDEIADTLLRAGIPVNTKGFIYIHDALELMDKDPYYFSGKICALYAKIVKQNGASFAQVERGIRYAFEGALTRGDSKLAGHYLDPVNTQSSNQLKVLFLRWKQDSHQRETALCNNMSVCRAEIYNEILAEMKVLTSTIRQAALSAVSQKTAV